MENEKIDLWGGSEYKPNNIYNVDCYKEIKKIPDKSIDLVIVDPPYKIESLKGGGMLKEKRIENLMNDLGNNNLNIGIKMDILGEYMRVMKKPNIYIWCNKKQIVDYIKYFVLEKHLNFVPLIWHKINAMPLCGGKYLDDCEYCLYFYENLKLNTSYDTANTVYNLPINIKDKKLYGHPTIKPLEIIKNLIINSSNENDIVLDTFLGSGTTAVACKELRRRYIGFEKEEEYFNIAKNRLEGISQQDKMLKEQGFQTIFDFGVE